MLAILLSLAVVSGTKPTISILSQEIDLKNMRAAIGLVYRMSMPCAFRKGSSM